jgi:hypothetical protein
MRILVRAILCLSLLVPSFLMADSESNATEPHYHWPEFPPFNPGSWAWPTTGYWYLPSFDRNYVSAPPPSSAAQPAPPTIIVFPPPAAAAPPQAPAPVAPAPSAANASAPQGSPIYLIALKNHAIRAAMSYSVENNVLHYVDLERAAKDVPLDQLDRPLTVELNRQRRVQFRLPPEPEQ